MSIKTDNAVAQLIVLSERLSDRLAAVEDAVGGGLDSTRPAGGRIDPDPAVAEAAARVVIEQSKGQIAEQVLDSVMKSLSTLVNERVDDVLQPVLDRVGMASAQEEQITALQAEVHSLRQRLMTIEAQRQNAQAGTAKSNRR